MPDSFCSTWRVRFLNTLFNAIENLSIFFGIFHRSELMLNEGGCVTGVKASRSLCSTIISKSSPFHLAPVYREAFRFESVHVLSCVLYGLFVSLCMPLPAPPTLQILCIYRRLRASFISPHTQRRRMNIQHE